MVFLIIFLVSLLGLYAYYVMSRKNTSIPNGLKEIPLEKGFPIIGVMYKAKPNLPFYLWSLGKKHGPIYRIKLGMRDIVILNNFDVIKKTLEKDGDNFSGRYPMRFQNYITRNSGIVSTDGDLWAEHRSFVLKVFHDFGIEKSKSFEVVENECQYLLEELEKLNGSPINISNYMSGHTANIVSKFIMNKRFSREDARFESIERLVAETSRKRDYVKLLFIMFPILDNINFLCKFFLQNTSKLRVVNRCHELFKQEVQEHIEKLDLHSVGEDLIDRFLIKKHQIQQKTGDVGTFTEWQLIRSAYELFTASYEATTTTLGWAFMFMSKYPEVQKKVYLEIIDKIGHNRNPTMNDKKSLNYTQAVMDEIMRMSSVVPLSVNHRNLDDASVNGYYIPKNSFIMPNLIACHYDPKIWKEPMEFNPNRFLSTNNEGEIKYTTREELIPFGIGKRQCLGESLARMEYFIFFTSIIKQFHVIFSVPLSDKIYQDVLRGKDSSIRISSKSNFIFIKR